jgi:sugar phosphate permease
MMKELGWTKADLGILTGALFWAYGIGHRAVRELK